MKKKHEMYKLKRMYIQAIIDNKIIFKEKSQKDVS